MLGAMTDLTGDAVSQMVARASHGDERALSQLMPLVNEAYLRLVKAKKQDWQTRAHFVAIATISIR